MAQPLSLATPTLIRLYLQQGHWAKAADMIANLLAVHPTHGEALALAQRLAICDRGRLKTRLHGHTLSISYYGPERTSLPATTRAGNHRLVIATYEDNRVGAARQIEVACEQTQGQYNLQLLELERAVVVSLQASIDTTWQILATSKVHEIAAAPVEACATAR